MEDTLDSIALKDRRAGRLPTYSHLHRRGALGTDSPARPPLHLHAKRAHGEEKQVLTEEVGTMHWGVRRPLEGTTEGISH